MERRWCSSRPGHCTSPGRGTRCLYQREFQEGNLGQLGSPSKAAHSSLWIILPFGSSLSLAHPHLALACGPGSLLLFFWLPLICGHPVTAARGLLGSAPSTEAVPCNHNHPRKIGTGMEYLPFDCLTTSENSSNSRKTPRNAEPEEEEPCQNRLLFIFFWAVESGAKEKLG